MEMINMGTEPWSNIPENAFRDQRRNTIIGTCPFCHRPLYNPKICSYCGGCINCGD